MREGGLMSCCVNSWKLHSLHLERARDHEGGSKLLGALTIGGGNAQAWGGNGQSQICPHATWNVPNREKTGAKMPFFA
jgi:hypothetical protein